MPTEGQKVHVNFYATYVKQIVSVVHPGTKRHVVELPDGTRLLLPVEASILLLEES